MCGLLQLLLLSHSDVAHKYDVATDRGLADAVAWMFVRALPENGLVEIVDSVTLSALNAPVSYYPSSGPSCESLCSDFSFEFELSMLMAFVWRYRIDAQQQFDISIPLQRAKFLCWFITHGVNEMGLQCLVSQEWRKWLTGIQLDYFNNGLSRLGLLAWISRNDLQEAFDVDSMMGFKALVTWTERQFSDSGSWAWLKSSVDDYKPTCVSLSNLNPHRSNSPGVNLIGFANGSFGIGEDLRMAAAACDAAKIPYSIVNISTGSRDRESDRYIDENLLASFNPKFRVNIFCMSAFDTVRVFLEKGFGLFNSRYNIGWWPWELPVWPRKLNAAFELMDEVWAATTFTFEMYRAVSSSKTFLMPPAVDTSRVRRFDRDRYGLAEHFLFLYVFDCKSYLARKNPIATLHAFRKAFGDDESSVGLVVKVMNVDNTDPAWTRFKRECVKDRRVVLIDQTLDRGEVLGLIRSCDAYVSLHRSEGFGRTLAEAMMFGKPVVATDFSGNTDYLNYYNGFPVKWEKRNVLDGEYPFVDSIDAAWWAEPDVVDAARQLRLARQAAGDWEFKRRIATFSARQFSTMHVGQLINNRLKQLSV